MMNFPNLIIIFLITLVFAKAEENRIPFYEDYLKESNADGFLKEARKFLEDNPNAVEAPRLAFDYLMVAKASREIEDLNNATSKLLFNYPQSLPTMHFISSFEKESKVLTELLVAKAALGDLKSKDFAVSYCRSLIMIARIQGPKFLADSSLRIRAYLLAEKAEVEEIKKSASKALLLESEKNSGISKVIQIVLNEQTPTEKLLLLSKFSGKDAEFATAYYLAQLNDKERNSDQIKIIQLKQSLFGKPKNIEKALSTIASLPTKLGKQADVQTFLGMAHYLDGKEDLAIKTLTNVSTKSSNETMKKWGKTAQSFANGIEFKENRKKLLLEALGNAFDQIGRSENNLFARIQWKNKEGEKTDAFIGISEEQKQLEIHVEIEGKPFFAYQTIQGKSRLFSSKFDSSISFNSPGIFTIPQIDIKRDIESGGFSYTFNLNFSSNQEDLFEEGSRAVNNPYLGTAKGREVLLNHLLASRALWILPAKTVRDGTEYPLSLIDPESADPTKVIFMTGIGKNLTGIRVGNFNLTDLAIGKTNVLKNLPKWPTSESEKVEKFDFPLFMKILQNILASS